VAIFDVAKLAAEQMKHISHLVVFSNHAKWIGILYWGRLVLTKKELGFSHENEVERKWK
jgi:hypothetical protein